MNETMCIAPPRPDEYFHYYHQYISKAPAKDFLCVFEDQVRQLRQELGNLSDDQVNCLHVPYTWTLKQVIGHLIDVERIFSYRMLRIASGDQTPIPGYEQDSYVDSRNYQSVSMTSLLDELEHLRMANVMLVRRLSSEDLERKGVASGHTTSARANLFILAGHVVHHAEIIKRRLDLAGSNKNCDPL
jgi:uncharacterized damage-inducible protein DinB